MYVAVKRMRGGADLSTRRVVIVLGALPCARTLAWLLTNKTTNTTTAWTPRRHPHYKGYHVHPPKAAMPRTAKYTTAASPQKTPIK